MKKLIVDSSRIILFIVFLLITGEIYPENYSNLPLHICYRFNPPILSEVKVFNHLFSRINIPGMKSQLRIGAPILPMEAARILLPYGKEAADIKIIPGEKVVLEGSYNVEPCQKPYFEREFAPPDPSIYDLSHSYPPSYYFTVRTDKKRGYRILKIGLSPVSYIPKTGKISFYKELTVVVETKPETTAPNTFRGLAKDAKVIRNQVDNPEVIGTYPLKE